MHAEASGKYFISAKVRFPVADLMAEPGTIGVFSLDVEGLGRMREIIFPTRLNGPGIYSTSIDDGTRSVANDGE
jgi:hypothetical protein